jgi:hypothetical protein
MRKREGLGVCQEKRGGLHVYIGAHACKCETEPYGAVETEQFSDLM